MRVIARWWGLPIISISDYLKRVRSVSSINEVKVVDAVLIDGRYGELLTNPTRYPRIVVLSPSGIEARTIKSEKMFDETVDIFREALLKGLYPVIRLHIHANTVAKIEAVGKGIRIEELAVKLRSIAEKSKKYILAEGEGVFYWSGENARIIDENGTPLVLPRRLLSPSLLAEILDEKKIRYMLLLLGGSQYADAFIVTEILEEEQEEKSTPTTNPVTAEETNDEEQEVDAEVKKEVEELIAQAIEVDKQ